MTVEELASWFVWNIVKAKAGIPSRISSNIASIHKLVEEGWTLTEIEQHVTAFAKSYPVLVQKFYHIQEAIGDNQPPSNIMEVDGFYYHNMLRITSAEVKIKMTPDGKFIRKEEPFFLEMIPRFTMGQLLEYWYKAHDIQKTDHKVKQDEGKFKYLLGIYNLDEILFAIDVSRSIRIEQQRELLTNAFDIEKYIEEAKKYILNKKNTHQLHGINKIIKKESVN